MKKARLAEGVLLCLMLPAFWIAARWERKMTTLQILKTVRMKGQGINGHGTMVLVSNMAELSEGTLKINDDGHLQNGKMTMITLPKTIKFNGRKTRVIGNREVLCEVSGLIEPELNEKDTQKLAALLKTRTGHGDIGHGQPKLTVSRKHGGSLTVQQADDLLNKVEITFPFWFENRQKDMTIRLAKMSAHISDGKIDFSKPIKVKISEDKKEIRKYNDFYANGKS